MIDGKLKQQRREAVREALRKTRLNWSEAGRIVGMTPTGVASLAIREGLVRRNGKAWVLK